MHPSQMGPFRRTVIVLLTIAFTGALLVYTGQANLDLLKSVYPNPQFYMFGLIALEGGVIYWLGYYLLHLSGAHKGIALFSLCIDALLAGTGFFYEMERVTNSLGTIQLPPIILIIGFSILFNVGMSLLSHLLPDGTHTPALPRQAQIVYEPAMLEQTTGAPLMERVKDSTASLVATVQDIGALAEQKRKVGRPARQEQEQITEELPIKK